MMDALAIYATQSTNDELNGLPRALYESSSSTPDHPQFPLTTGTRDDFLTPNKKDLETAQLKKILIQCT